MKTVRPALAHIIIIALLARMGRKRIRLVLRKILSIVSITAQLELSKMHKTFASVMKIAKLALDQMIIIVLHALVERKKTNQVG